MRKVWIYQRKNLNGWWVGWYESGKRRSKVLPNKALAEHFQKIKYQQLNSDVFTSILTVDWETLCTEYEHSKEILGLTQEAIYQAMLSLKHFEDICGPLNSKQITQNSIGEFILERGKQVKRPTLNKDIRNLQAFINWAQKNRYLNDGLEIKTLKVQQQPVITLDSQQVRELLLAASPYPAWRIRILLALATGLRKGDIETIRIRDIHFDRGSITTKSQKTGKSMAERPVPANIITELSNYLAALPDGQRTLFPDTFTHKKWKKIRERAGLPDLKFHDLRKTFASMLAQRGISTAVTQKLLEHATSQLTNKVYTNVDPVLRQAVDRLPVDEWL